MRADKINSSLQSSTVPTSVKIVSIAPILKKPGLDPNDFNNCNPVAREVSDKQKIDSLI